MSPIPSNPPASDLSSAFFAPRTDFCPAEGSGIAPADGAQSAFAEAWPATGFTSLPAPAHAPPEATPPQHQPGEVWDGDTFLGVLGAALRSQDAF